MNCLQYCLQCSGLIPEPYKSYGYAGKFCQCPKQVSPANQWTGMPVQQMGYSEMSRPGYITDILNRLERIETMLRESGKAKP